MISLTAGGRNRGGLIAPSIEPIHASGVIRIAVLPHANRVFVSGPASEEAFSIVWL